MRRRPADAGPRGRAEAIARDPLDRRRHRSDIHRTVAARETIAGDADPVRPEFEPGDGLLFDERFLHRTYLHEHMTEGRYALECWLFAPSHPSPDYLPFLV